MKGERLELTGRLLLREQEGGFAAPEIICDDTPLDHHLIVWHLGLMPENGRNGTVPTEAEDMGRVRIIVERIDGN